MLLQYIKMPFPQASSSSTFNSFKTSARQDRALSECFEKRLSAAKALL
jgi:hypothetical protein